MGVSQRQQANIGAGSTITFAAGGGLPFHPGGTGVNLQGEQLQREFFKPTFGESVTAARGIGAGPALGEALTSARGIGQSAEFLGSVQTLKDLPALRGGFEAELSDIEGAAARGGFAGSGAERRLRAGASRRFTLDRGAAQRESAAFLAQLFPQIASQKSQRLESIARTGDAATQARQQALQGLAGASFQFGEIDRQRVIDAMNVATGVHQTQAGQRGGSSGPSGETIGAGIGAVVGGIAGGVVPGVGIIPGAQAGSAVGGSVGALFG